MCSDLFFINLTTIFYFNFVIRLQSHFFINQLQQFIFDSNVPSFVFIPASTTSTSDNYKTLFHRSYEPSMCDTAHNNILPHGSWLSPLLLCLWRSGSLKRYMGHSPRAFCSMLYPFSLVISNFYGKTIVCSYLLCLLLFLLVSDLIGV